MRPPWWVPSHGQKARAFHTWSQPSVSLYFLLLRPVIFVSYGLALMFRFCVNISICAYTVFSRWDLMSVHTPLLFSQSQPCCCHMTETAALWLWSLFWWCPFTNQLFKPPALPVRYFLIPASGPLTASLILCKQKPPSVSSMALVSPACLAFWFLR